MPGSNRKALHPGKMAECEKVRQAGGKRRLLESERLLKSSIGENLSACLCWILRKFAVAEGGGSNEAA